MHMAIEAKQKLGFIIGTLSKPAANLLHHVLWTCCNSMALPWIVNALLKDITNNVIHI